MKVILQAVWMRSGKRLRRSLYAAERFALYDQVFRFRFKEVLNEKFIKEAGLNNSATFDVVCESLRTDYGLHVKLVQGKIDNPKAKSTRFKPMGKNETKAEVENKDTKE